MASKYWTLLIFLFFPFALQAEQFETMRIAKIDVIAENLVTNASFNPAQVRGKLQSKVGNFFSQTEFDCDLKMLAEEYDRVEPTVQVINDEIHVMIRLWMKPKIRQVSFCGNERVSARKLKKTLDVKPDTLFERGEFTKAFNKLKLLYIKKGYFEAELDYDIVPVPGDNAIDIQVNICEGRSGKIQKIVFHGLTSKEESEILEFIATKKYLFFLSWYTGAGIYHPEMIEHDRLQIVNYLQNKGFADANVDICMEEDRRKDRIVLAVTVDKGQCYSFGTIRFSGNCLFGDTDIWNAISFRERYAYSPEKLRDAVKAIGDLYGGRGYIDSNVDVQLSLREDSPVYDVEIVITEGDQYYIGLVKVFGNGCTQSRVILHESLLLPGEVFDNCKLEATEKRLLNTGFFKNVNVYAVRSQYDADGDERLYRDVYIEVEEDQTGNFGLFGGASSLDNIFGGAEITERNFNLAGIFDFPAYGFAALRGGGEYAHFKANFGSRQTSYVLQWTKPYFLDTPWILGIELEKNNNRAVSRAYDIKTYGGSVHTTYIYNCYLKYDIHYRALHSGISSREKHNPIFKESADGTGLISAAGTSLIYDSTDCIRRPTRGFRSRLLFEVAGLGGNFEFLKFAYLNSYYYPFSRKDVLKFKADFQFIKTYGSTKPLDLPLGERFFLGGETTVRGYRSYIIGPKIANNQPIGGVSSMLLSEEFQHTLLRAPCVDAFVFVDAGYVSLTEFTLDWPAVSVGFGLRAEIMRNMPIMIGLGWPIHPIEKTQNGRQNMAQRFFFSMGACF